MFGILSQIPVRVAPAPFPIEAILGICVPCLSLLIVGVTLIIAINKRKMQRDDMEATLKMEMIERGFSAEDIERALAARLGPPRGGCKHREPRPAPREFQGEGRR